MRVHPRHNVVARARLAIEVEILDIEYAYEELARAFLRVSLAPKDEEESPARVEQIRAIFLARCEELDLTFGEKLAVVGGILQSNAKYVIRHERHGNFETPGGLAE